MNRVKNKRRRSRCNDDYTCRSVLGGTAIGLVIVLRHDPANIGRRCAEEIYR